MPDMSPPPTPPGNWALIWQGDPPRAALAAEMLSEHGLDVRQTDGLTVRLYVKPEDEETAQQLFNDWEI